MILASLETEYRRAADHAARRTHAAESRDAHVQAAEINAAQHLLEQDRFEAQEAWREAAAAHLVAAHIAAGGIPGPYDVANADRQAAAPLWQKRQADHLAAWRAALERAGDWGAARRGRPRSANPKQAASRPYLTAFELLTLRSVAQAQGVSESDLIATALRFYFNHIADVEAARTAAALAELDPLPGPTKKG